MTRPEVRHLVCSHHVTIFLLITQTITSGIYVHASMQGTNGSLVVSIEQCIIHHQDIQYVAIGASCVCQADVLQHGVVVEWVDEKDNTIMVSAVDKVTLTLTSGHIDSTIICRGRYENLIGRSQQLPSIVYGPEAVTLDLPESGDLDLHTSTKCPLICYFNCEVDKRQFNPGVKVTGMVSMTGSGYSVGYHAKQTAHLVSGSSEKFYFKHEMVTSGHHVVQCVATNSVLGNVQVVDSAVYEAKGNATRACNRSGHRKVRYVAMATINGCTVTLDGKVYVDGTKVCMCHGTTTGTAVEWIDSLSGKCFAHGNDVVPLPITPEIIGINDRINCRAKYKGIELSAKKLPKIIHGPSDVKLTARLHQMYTSKTCPQSFYFTCSVPKNSIFPKADFKLVTRIERRKETLSPALSESKLYRRSIENENVPLNDQAMSVDYRDSYKFLISIRSHGLVSVKCVATNSWLEHIQATDEQTVLVKASNLTPVMSTGQEGSPVSKENILIPHNTGVSVVCTAPWGNDPKLTVTLQCGESTLRQTGVNRVTILIEGSSDKNGTSCTCKMELDGCTHVGMAERPIFVLENAIETGTTSPPDNEEGSSPDTHTSSEVESLSATFIGIGVGVTLALVLVAAFFFLLGVKVGSRKTRKKMEREASLGKISFTPNSAVTLQPAGNHSGRGPQRGAHCINDRTAGSLRDGAYSHIDGLYQDDSDYEHPIAQNSSSKVRQPPRKSKSRKGPGQAPEENLYDEAFEYDVPSSQLVSDSVYEGYLRPGQA